MVFYPYPLVFSAGQWKITRYRLKIPCQWTWWFPLPWRIPSGYVKIAIENGHRNSGFTHWKWWFSIVMLVYQRARGYPAFWKPKFAPSAPQNMAFIWYSTSILGSWNSHWFFFTIQVDHRLPIQRVASARRRGSEHPDSAPTARRCRNCPWLRGRSLHSPVSLAKNKGDDMI